MLGLNGIGGAKTRWIKSIKSAKIMKNEKVVVLLKEILKEISELYDHLSVTNVKKIFYKILKNINEDFITSP